MSKRFYDEQTIQTAITIAVEEGMTAAVEATGVPRTTINTWMIANNLEAKRVVPKRRKSKSPKVEEAPQLEKPSLENGHKDLAISSLKRQLAEVQNKNIEDMSAVWMHTERENEKKIARLLDMSDVSVEIHDSRPIGLVFMSDFHITSGCTNLKRLREDGEAIADAEGAYALLVGDYIDNHIKHRAAVVARDMSPTRELELFNYWLSIVKDSVLAMVSGNHDMFSRQSSGLDPLASIAEQNKLYYVADELNLNINLGGHVYRVMIRHQTRYNSGLNHAHGLFRHLDFAADVPWDIGCAGHHHTSAIASQWKLGKERYAIRPGSYQHSTSFSRALGFPAAQPYSPMTIIWPGSRKILMVQDVRHGLEILQAQRSAQ